jgi:putative flippase GtrA
MSETATPASARPAGSRTLLRQAVLFLAVGGVGFVVDVGVFNVLRATVLSPAHVAGGAMWAKTISMTLAIAVNWIGNRTVAFREERRTGSHRAVAREAIDFAAASLLGSTAALLCLAVSHYGLHLTSAAADNISANVVGLALGTALRFALYRAWVFRPRAHVTP